MEKKEVTTWLWEVWNEPNIGYWSGTFDEYCKLYDYAADGLKQACPECTIGGPHTTSPRDKKARKFLIDFIDHCLRGTNYATGKTGTPLQYIGFHAKGSPELINNQVRMNMSVQLKDIKTAFATVDSFPELKNIPVIIGECDPEGCAACSATKQPQYNYRNGTMYSSYTAASFARIYELMDEYNVNLRGAVSWSFEFEDQPWFAGFRDLATNGIDKPVLNVFRMFGMMKGERIKVISSDVIKAEDIITNGITERHDINAIASKDDRAITVMVWNYNDDDVKDSASKIHITINGIERNKVLMHHYRVDDEHSNSFEKWKAMNKPQHVNSEQFTELEKAGKLQLITSPQTKQITNSKLELQFDLPSHGVSLIQLTW